MAEWIYNNTLYHTEPIPIYNTIINKNRTVQNTDYKLLRRLIEHNNHKGVLVYHKRWDKCYYLYSCGHHGSGWKIKAWITDVYTNKQHVTLLEDLEFVK